MAQTIRTFAALIILTLGAHTIALGQSTPNAVGDPLSQVTTLELSNQTVFDGLAKLSQMVPISVERQLTSKRSPHLPPVLRFTGQVSGVTVRQALDCLFTLDARYTWTSDDGMVNVFPRYVQNDPDYPLNLEIEPFELRDVTKVDGAVMHAASHAIPPQDIAILHLGETDFTKPVTLSFAKMTLRQALNRIARPLCSTCGWQFSGTDEFHYVVFHKWLVPEPPKR